MATGGLTGLIHIINKQHATVWIWKKAFSELGNYLERQLLMKQLREEAVSIPVTGKLKYLKTLSEWRGNRITMPAHE